RNGHRHLRSVLKQAGIREEFVILIEKTRTGYSACAPDLPGCVAPGPDPGARRERDHEGGADASRRHARARRRAAGAAHVDDARRGAGLNPARRAAAVQTPSSFSSAGDGWTDSTIHST